MEWDVVSYYWTPWCTGTGMLSFGSTHGYVECVCVCPPPETVRNSHRRFCSVRFGSVGRHCIFLWRSDRQIETNRIDANRIEPIFKTNANERTIILFSFIGLLLCGWFGPLAPHGVRRGRRGGTNMPFLPIATETIESRTCVERS